MRLPTDTGTYSQAWIEDQPAVVTTLSMVLRSDIPSFKSGDLVAAMAPAGEFAAIPAELVPQARVLPPLPPGVNIAPQTIVGALGVAGLSAYVSFHEFVKEPRAGKTLFVSAASGGVGQIVGQLAKMNGMKVIGSTGSAAKVDFVVDELGYDGAWNYKTEKTSDALERLAPEGLDVYYDNVGGEQLETALTKMKDFGTIGKQIVSNTWHLYKFAFVFQYSPRCRFRRRNRSKQALRQYSVLTIRETAPS